MIRAGSALATDLYQLTMVQSYLDHGLTGTASFEFFVRKIPAHRGFLLFCGLESALNFLQSLQFNDSEIAWLKQSGRFSESLTDYLADVRFTGEVDAMPEGTIFFPNEPVLRVTAPLPVAQLVETQIINFLHVQTLVASKAVRMRLVCPEQLLVDFGLRRTHGLDTGLAAARAGYIAGLSGTSNVQAGARWDIPIFGTMAHAYVQAHVSEEEAFLHFARSHPDNVTLLIDTYDTEEGARKVVNIAPQLKKEGINLRAVRLDSGDLGAHARNVRRILDDGGLEETHIFASGNLDEYALQKLMDEKAPIDGFGIGTRMNTSSDMPYLDCAYKLQAYAGAPKRKTSEGKATLPGIKQVYRSMEKGVMAQDVITTADDDATPGIPLLKPVMRAGEATAPLPRLEDIRKYVAEQLQTLPAELKTLEPKTPYPVHISPALQQLIADMDAQQ